MFVYPRHTVIQERIGMNVHVHVACILSACNASASHTWPVIVIPDSPSPDSPSPVMCGEYCVQHELTLGCCCWSLSLSLSLSLSSSLSVSVSLSLSHRQIGTMQNKLQLSVEFAGRRVRLIRPSRTALNRKAGRVTMRQALRVPRVTRGILRTGMVLRRETLQTL